MVERKWMRASRLAGLMALWALAGCGDDDGGMVPDGGLTALCTSAADCDDGVFCNGIEVCAPGNDEATAFGCVAAAAAPCLDGQVCDEEMDRCTTRCELGVDADGDGVDAMECGGEDCDDADANRFPGNAEVCDTDGHDEDCDPTTLGARDADRDGVIDARCCNGEVCGEDCDDLRPAVRPDGAEVCDLLDNDCDGMTDEGVQVPGWEDLDGDQHGDPGAATMACAGAPRFADVDDDCDDDAPPVHGAQVEICDGLDNDCDDAVDEQTRPISWYRDADGDGFGNATGGVEIACAPPEGYSSLPTDCDDEGAGVNPAAVERCNGRDDDCNGVADFQIGPNDFEDDDRDGFTDVGCPDAGDDCDDGDAATYPGAAEICDGRDNDCDGQIDEDPQEVGWYPDEDGDGVGAGESPARTSCERPPGHVLVGGDCDDTDEGRTPGRLDGCDGVDDDCDGETDEDALAVAFYVDLDGDGAGGMEPVLACLGEPGVGAFPSDCDDADDARYPGAPELCDGVDNDCDDEVDEGDDASLCDLPNASGTCTASACVLSCEGRFLDCDGEPLTGCEADPMSDPRNCGACGNDCGPVDGGSSLCVDGACALSCDPGFGDCENGAADGCEASLMDDPLNCGACRARCEPGPNQVASCDAGVCETACVAGFEDCNGDPADGCEAEVAFDPAHCGSCGAACPGATDACVSGLCQAAAFESDGSDGAFMPTEDTELDAGVYQFTTIVIPAGVTVTTNGTDVLELYASGDVVVEGTIDVSGGPGGASVGHATCEMTSGGGVTGDADAPAPTAVDDGVCRDGGGGGSGVPGSPARAVPTAPNMCVDGSEGRFGGGMGAVGALGCQTSAGGGGGYAGGGGGTKCESSVPFVDGGDGASIAGVSTGGAGGPDDCSVGGGGGEPGFGAYSGGNGGGNVGATGGGGGSIGRDAIADLAVATTFRPGSGGGGGGHNRGEGGGGGGGGGGALRIASATSITITGRLLANGGPGGPRFGFGNGASGGGGSGGVIYLAAPELSTAGEVSAVGGVAPADDSGAGGLGRIRLSTIPERCSLAGTFEPRLADGCARTDPAVPERVYIDVYPF